MHLAIFRSECTKLSGAHILMTMGARQDDAFVGIPRVLNTSCCENNKCCEGIATVIYHVIY